MNQMEAARLAMANMSRRAGQEEGWGPLAEGRRRSGNVVKR